MVIKEQLYKMRNTQYENGLRELISYIKKFKNTKEMRMVEIGSYAGESTMIFAEDFKEVISIDPFINDYDPNDITCKYMELEKVYDTFKEVVDRNGNIEHIRMTSDDAVESLTGTSVDFIYIDGLHTYEQIKKDIKNYLPLLKPNCLIAGHDYHRNWDGVVRGINEILGVPDATFSDTSWIKLIK
jgi:predicted O-methyltransferase YrrM